MRLIILGASGSLGRRVLSQALAAGHEVTAFVRTPSKLCITALVFVTAIACVASASAESLPNEEIGTAEGNSSAPSASELSANELAKEISNPVTSLWQLQFQFNNVELESGTPLAGERVHNLYFQPVMPVSLTEKLNLITRPVIPLYQSVPYPTATGSVERTTGFGDTILAQVLSPAGTEPWIWGAGPTWIFPTAGSDLTGQGKWQVGPAVGGGYITSKFMIAALAQQWWSFAGDHDRPDTSQLNLLPLVQ